MNVRFIDTSIMCNLLEVPKLCDDKEEVKREWKEVLERKETLIMPLATIIGTIMIWSKDEHLSAYRQENVSLQRRRKR